MSSARALRKRQSRLAFTPLPSSSPAAQGYNKQIQERAAAVSLDVSPSPAKRRKVNNTEQDDDLSDIQIGGANESIPTPAASLQRQTQYDINAASQSDDEPVQSTQRRSNTKDKLTSRLRSRQQRLDFSNGREHDTFSSPIKLSSSARHHSPARSGMFHKRSSGQVVDVSSDESDVLLSLPEVMAQSKSKKKEKSKSRSTRATRSSQKPIVVESGSESDNIKVSSEPTRIMDQESEDNDDDMPTTAGTQRRKRARRGSRNSFIASSPPRIIESDDEIEIIERPNKRRQRGGSEDDDEEQSEDESITPKRKLKRGRQASRQEIDDLEEDLDFLGPSSDVENSARRPRNTQTAQKDARQQALEKLKRQRSGLQAATPADDEEDEGADEDNQVYEEEEEEEDGDQPQPVSSRQFFQEDEHDEDFIEEDAAGDDPLGFPDGDIPLEFTRYASMKPKELFKYAVEWMVQKKINPAFQMNDDIYGLTFRKLDDEVKGLAGSKFKSSAWTQDFTTSLNSRPDIAYEPIDRDAEEHWMRDHCDACNRTGHPATYQIQFQGKPYHAETLEEVAGNEDDDDEEDSSSENESGRRDSGDSPDYNARSQEVPPANTIYYVGKFCMSNAQTAHALQHWRYHLNEWVVSWVIRNGFNTPEKIVERDRWSTKKRRKYANKIADRMEQEGVVKTLWRDFRENIDNARNSKQGRYSFGSP